MTVEVLLSTDEIQVLGGPSEIQLSVDFGEPGPRGSNIFTSVGNPNTALSSVVSPEAYDLCVNILSTDPTGYGYLYQYVSDAANDFSWEPIVKLTPNIYYDNVAGTFTAGSRVVQVPLINILDLDTAQGLTSANFNVQYTILNDKPISSSVSVGSITTTVGGDYVLPLTFNAMEYTSGSWVSLDDVIKTISLAISIVV